MPNLQCINCNVRLARLRRHSLSTESEAVINIIRLWTYPRDITPLDSICHACWKLASHQPSSDMPRQFGHLHICVVCGRSTLRRNSRRVIFEGANHEEQRMVNVISNWIQPRELSPEHETCVLCWQRARRTARQSLSLVSETDTPDTLQLVSDNEPAEMPQMAIDDDPAGLLTQLISDDNTLMCNICGNSLTTLTRPSSSPEGQILERINEMIENQQIDPDSKLCQPCWLRVKRYSSESSGKKKKYDVSMPHTQSESDTLDYAITNLNTIELHHRMSSRRKKDDQNNGDVATPKPDSQSISDTKNFASTIELPLYKKISQSQQHCIFPECKDQNLQIVSNNIQVRILKDYNIFIPRNSVICNTHLNSNNWNILYEDKTNISLFAAEDIEQIFSLVQTKANTDVNFKNYMTIDEQTFVYFLGVNRETVNVILKYLPQIEEIDHGVLGLIGLFIKHENGRSNERIANLLKLPLKSLQISMEQVKEILVNNPIVTKNMGIEYLLKRHL